MKDIPVENRAGTPNFNQHPAVSVSEYSKGYSGGWNEIFGELSAQPGSNISGKKIIVVDCYQGVLFEELLDLFSGRLKPVLTITSRDYFLPPEEISRITWPDVTDDRIFGYVSRLTMKDFISSEKLAECRDMIDSLTGGTVLVFGYGAALVVSNPALLIYADMPRREIQLRMKSGRVDGLGINNRNELFEQQYKRGFFVDWRVCDRHKKKLKDKWDFILDSTDMNEPAMIAAGTYDKALTKAVSTPFSVVPTFDPGLWGGQWMKEKFGLDPSPPNYAWCFNCIVEENSLMFDFGRGLFETPASNLVYFRPVELLGEAVYGRFGDEFPIRFDYLDTMEGGNLSLQVHPVTEYIQEKFGMHYTQDESYYIVDTGEDASVYLGLREGISPDEMTDDLRNAQNGKLPFDDSRYVNRWPAEKHDHFLIPGGTVHCSGKNCLVLEISSTTFIFTFKLWDWGRIDSDGRPRPINIEHGKNVIQWERDTEYVRSNLINRIRTVAEGTGWREESTGLHVREFIETRRHWFTKKVIHNTNDGVNVLDLVEGREIIVESPEGRFEPFIVHYAEVFIVPAAVGEYTIRPYGESEKTECATIKAYVRT